MTPGDTQSPNVADAGAWLAAAREQIGWSLVQAADQLHLDVSAVKAIEAGDFAALGAAVYARGHLRRYAGLLGLPVQEVEKAFLQAHPARSTPDLRHGAGLLQKSDAGAGAIRPGTAAVGAVVLVVIGVVLWAKRVPHGPPAARAPAAVRAPAQLTSSKRSATPTPTPTPTAASDARATADAHEDPQGAAHGTPSPPPADAGGLLRPPAPTRMLAGAAADSARQFNGQPAALWDVTADSAALRFPLDGGGGVINDSVLHPVTEPSGKAPARARGARP